jgi:hypothetical protein
MLFTRNSLKHFGLSTKDIDSIMHKMRKSIVMARSKKEITPVFIDGSIQDRMSFNLAYDIDDAIEFLSSSKRLPRKADFWKHTIGLLKIVKETNV